MDDLSSLPQADQDAIGVRLTSLLSGFQERDADKLVDVYSSDADWVNASEVSRRGQKKSSSTCGACSRTTTSMPAP